ADDPRVAAMARSSAARTVTFGIEQDADYRARDVSAVWPKGVSFVLEHDGKEHRVETGLFGAHFAPNVLASLATAHIAGMPLEDAVAAVREIVPLEGRMSEVKSPDGVTFIRDDYKAPWWGLPFTVEFIRDAQAMRKVLVLGEMSDNPGDKATKFRRVINSALDHVACIVVVGPAGRKLNSALLEHERVEVCDTIDEARRYLASFLLSGDLVVLKGIVADHLERLARARVETVGCWRSRCGRKHLCSECDLLVIPAGPDATAEQRS
ncbi:MAG: Mur ligase family protein, partial [Verrucomicrobia bacterium]|nr:Mur ligase family protein [Verrucomicrobiota bacterium]